MSSPSSGSAGAAAGSGVSDLGSDAVGVTGTSSAGASAMVFGFLRAQPAGTHRISTTIANHPRRRIDDPSSFIPGRV